MSIDSVDSPGTCTLDSDCPDGFICDGGICVPAGGGGDPVDPLPGLGNYLQRRYSCNIGITDEMSVLDLFYEVIFPSSRMYFKQHETGRLALGQKKPASFALMTATNSSNSCSVDNAQPWIGNTGGWVLLQPHTNRSEIRQVTDSGYSSSQNATALSSTGGLFSISGFAGCDGANTPATASITVTGHTAATACTITIGTVTFGFTTTAADTEESIASYIAGIISSHPAIWRRYTVSWTAGSAVVNLTGRVGRIVLSSAPANTLSAPISNPSTAPTLSASGSGSSLLAGTYAVAYSATNANGESLLSPYKLVTITAGQNIAVSTVTPPAGATGVKWYVSPEADSNKLRYRSSNSGTGYTISGALPKLTAPLPPDLNRTGAEVMMVQAVFSDRADTRTSATRSNVLKATYSWLLGNRTKTVNQINLKYRDKTQDWRMVELRLRDDVHIDKVKKKIPEEVNGQAIDNTDQAYRITSGLLAEKQDADFFYKWASLREAMLLEEGDVVACTDDGSGVYNIPVIIEEIEYNIDHNSMPIPRFVARKYSSRLYDDSIVEAAIPVVSEAAIVP